MNPPLLQVDLTAGYAQRQVLDHVAFQLDAGEALGLVGVSGSGKSTLLLAMLGLLQLRKGWARGTVHFTGTEFIGLPQSRLRAFRGRHIALIPQSPLSALSPVLRLRSHFKEAWRAHEPADERRMEQRIAEVMEDVQLGESIDMLNRKSTEISVGQAQRLLIALALLHRPKLIIADEPISALDPMARMDVLRLLADLSRQSQTSLLYISHDILSVLQLCDRVAVLDQGKLVECLQTDAINRACHPATLHLLRALPFGLDVLSSRTLGYLGASRNGTLV